MRAVWQGCCFLLLLGGAVTQMEYLEDIDDQKLQDQGTAGDEDLKRLLCSQGTAGASGEQDEEEDLQLSRCSQQLQPEERSNVQILEGLLGLDSSEGLGSFKYDDDVRSPVSTSQCPFYHDCVPYYQCLDGVINTSGEGLINPRVKPRSECTTTDNPNVPGTCCRLPGPVPLEYCPESQSCVLLTTCDGDVTTDPTTGHYVECYLGPGSNNGVCCSHRPSLTCPGEQVCVTNAQCTAMGQVNTDGSGIFDVRLNVQVSVCYLDDTRTAVGVCCEPPSPLQVCPGSGGFQVCVLPNTCDGQLTYDSLGRPQRCYTGQAIGVCCTPRRLRYCPRGRVCLVREACRDYGNVIGEDNPECLVSDRVAGVCCPPPKPTPKPILNTCPEHDGRQAVCLPELLCFGEALSGDETDGRYITYTPTGNWRRCHFSASGLTAPGICCRNQETPVDHYVAAEGCGVRNVALDLRVGSPSYNPADQAGFGEIPWQAIIFHSNYTYRCGATLINSGVLLTAAHCLVGVSPTDFKVRLGEWKVDGFDEPLTYVDVDVNSITIHPDYNPRNLHNDIAVLELAHKVTYQYHINRICLTEIDWRLEPGARCIASGWGKNSFNGGEYQVILKKVDLPLLDHNDCQNKLRRTRLGRYFQLDDSFTCAGGEEGKDACTGDGGGPLMCEDGTTGSFFLAGITSWGIGCGMKDVPGVYVNVKRFIPWVISVLKPAVDQPERPPRPYGR